MSMISSYYLMRRWLALPFESSKLSGNVRLSLLICFRPQPSDWHCIHSSFRQRYLDGESCPLKVAL
ncbi:MAG: hypothetical protein CMJ59_09215 [Planctomycetaceae bacterium]|nr:hypothetical protein [Planctomycetaceae bacterium]